MRVVKREFECQKGLNRLERLSIERRGGVLESA